MSRWFPLVTLLACSVSTEPLPSPPPPLTLTATPLIAGESATITVQGASPGEMVYLTYSSRGPGAGPCPPALQGECLGLLNAALLQTLTADDDGTAQWTVVLPDPFPLDVVHMQAVTLGPPLLSDPVSWDSYDHRIELPISPTWQDDFDRPDGTLLGSTVVGDGGWHDPAPGTDYVAIAGSAARLHYFVQSPSTPDQWMTLDALPHSDGVVEATLRSATNYSGVRLAYRLDEQDAGYRDPGYHLLIDEQEVTLFAGSWPIASAPFTDDHQEHTWRIRYEGDRHMVSVDGELLLDVSDGTYTHGWVGVGAFYAIAYVDDIAVQDLGGDAAIDWDDAHSFDGPDTTLVDGWVESGDPTTSHIQQRNDELYIHYFHDGTSIPRQSAIRPADVTDLELRARVRGTPNYMDASRPFGLSYRVQDDGVGYRVELTEDGVALLLDDTLLATGPWTVDTSWHDLRVVAAGDRHQVWLDGHRLIDTTDGSLVAPGDVGVFATYSIVAVDELSWRSLELPMVYPSHRPGQLSTFPIGVYSVTRENTAEIAKRGFSLIQTYGPTEGELARDAARHGMRVLSTVGTYHVDDANTPSNTTETEALDQMDLVLSHGNRGWWEMPEEMRYWRTNEVTELTNLRAWTHTHDPQRAPHYMYSPNARDAAAISELVPYLDIVSAAGYRTLTQQPAPWIRHQVHTAIDGIEGAGYTVGADYLHGERVPAITLATGNLGPTSEVEAYHDVWAAIAEGARGIMVYSYFWALANDDPDSMRGFARAAMQLTQGPTALGPVVLYGTPVHTTVQILDGPALCDPFTPHNGTPIELPSVAHRAWDFGGARTVVVVNSSDEPVRARISGLAGDVATVLYEGRALPVSQGVIEDDIEPRGVHLYRSHWTP